MLTEQEIRLALQHSLLDEIYDNIKAIGYKYNPNLKYFKLTYFLDRIPVEKDYSNLENVIAQFM